jgi:hypothetical protein
MLSDSLPQVPGSSMCFEIRAIGTSTLNETEPSMIFSSGLSAFQAASTSMPSAETGMSAGSCAPMMLAAPPTEPRIMPRTIQVTLFFFM